jgi:anti-anti-sigma factor
MTDQLHIRLVPEGGVIVVRAIGEIDLATVNLLDDALEQATARAPEAVHLDLSRVSYFGSEGIHSLLRAWGRARKKSIEFKVSRSTATIRKVLDIVGVGFAVDDTTVAALH